MTRFSHSSQHSNRFISVSPLIFKILTPILFTLVMFSVTSCEEAPTTIGTKLLPAGDFVGIKSIDTLSANSYTVYEDSVRSDNPTTSYIGQIYDPYFGTTTAGFVSQIRLFPAWDNIPFIIDSVRLYLRILKTRGGDSGLPHTLRLSEIAEQIYTDKPYYSNSQIPLTGYKVTDIILPVLREDTINNVVLTLPVSFGEYVLRDTSMLFYSNSNPDDFRSYFKGLFFEMDPGSDHLIVELTLINQNIQYYNNAIKLFGKDNNGNLKAYSFALDAVNKNAAYNTYIHDFTTAEPDKKIKHINDGYRDTLSYIQYLNGVFTKITLPGLEKLKNDPENKNIAINKARLIVPAYFDGDIYKVSKAPSLLLLRYKGKDGTKYIVPDYFVDQYHIFYDGGIDTTARKYNFNIATFVQGYLEDATGNAKPELEMYQAEGTSNVILKTNLGTPSLKFEFTFTKF